MFDGITDRGIRSGVQVTDGSRFGVRAGRLELVANVQQRAERTCAAGAVESSSYILVHAGRLVVPPQSVNFHSLRQASSRRLAGRTLVHRGAGNNKRLARWNIERCFFLLDARTPSSVVFERDEEEPLRRAVQIP